MSKTIIQANQSKMLCKYMQFQKKPIPVIILLQKSVASNFKKKKNEKINARSVIN